MDALKIRADVRFKGQAVPCVRLAGADLSPTADEDGGQLPLRQCQIDCLEACAKGARVIEMACGTGKTRVIKELVSVTSGRVAWF